MVILSLDDEHVGGLPEPQMNPYMHATLLQKSTILRALKEVALIPLCPVKISPRDGEQQLSVPESRDEQATRGKQTGISLQNQSLH